MKGWGAFDPPLAPGVRGWDVTGTPRQKLQSNRPAPRRPRGAMLRSEARRGNRRVVDVHGAAGWGEPVRVASNAPVQIVARRSAEVGHVEDDVAVEPHLEVPVSRLVGEVGLEMNPLPHGERLLRNRIDRLRCMLVVEVNG